MVWLCIGIWCGCSLKGRWKLGYLGFGCWIVIAASLVVFVDGYVITGQRIPSVWKCREILQTCVTKGVQRKRGVSFAICVLDNLLYK